MTITICSSANFYRKVNDIADVLEARGVRVLVPATAKKMRQTGDYETSHYKTWYANEADYDKKADLMRGHFAEIAKADAILVVNESKHGMDNYIGGNVIMEMAVAFYLGKRVYVYNNLPLESPFLEEIRGVLPVVLHGKLDAIKA